MPFVSLGLVPEFASSLSLPQLLGHARAAEKLLLGDPFTGAEAVECGIANAVLPAGEVVNHARRIAERFNALPPGAVRETKRLMRRGRAAAVLETIGVEGERFGERLHSPEAKEAFSAFFEKRKPDFSQVLRACRDARARHAGRALALKLALAPLLVAPGDARRGAVRWCCPRPTGERDGRRRRRRAGAAARADRRRFVGGRRRRRRTRSKRVVGHLARSLHRRPRRPIEWALRARTGLTTRGVHELLVRRARRSTADVAVVVTGVNDVIDQVSTRRARARPGRARRLAARVAGVRHVVFAPLPPMRPLPAPAASRCAA